MIPVGVFQGNGRLFRERMRDNNGWSLIIVDGLAGMIAGLIDGKYRRDGSYRRIRPDGIMKCRIVIDE